MRVEVQSMCPYPIQVLSTILEIAVRYLLACLLLCFSEPLRV